MAGETKSLQFSDGVAVAKPTVTGHEVTTLTMTEQASAPDTPASGEKILYPKTDGKLYTKDDEGNEIEVGTDISTLTLTEQESAPSTPASGKKILYAKDDGKVYTKDDQGIEQEVGSGAGGGGAGKNYVTNPSASSDTTGWAESGSGTLSRTTTASNLPREHTTPSAFSFTSGAANDYAYYRFTLDDADLNAANLLLKLAAKVADSDTWKLEVYYNSASDYSGDYTEIPLVHDDSDGDYFLPATTADFTTYWTPSGKQYIEIRLVDTVGEKTIYFSDVLVGPGTVSATTPVTGWQAYTPTISGFGTVTVSSAHWRQVGDSAEISVKFTPGTPTSSLAQIGLPPNLNTRPLANTTEVVGSWYRDNSDTTKVKHGAVLAPDSSQSYVWLSRYTENAAVGPFTAANGSTLVASGEALNVVFKVPIAEWAGATQYQMSDSVTYANTRMSAVFTANSDLTTNYETLNGQNVWGLSHFTVENDDQSIVGADGIITIPVDGWYSVKAFVRVQGAPHSTSTLGILVYDGSTNSYHGSSMLADTQKQVYAAELTRFFNAGDKIALRPFIGESTCDVINAANSTGRFEVTRLADFSAGQPVGFGLATSTQPGLVSREATETLILDGNFTAGAVKFVRVGSVVTATVTVLPTFSSTSNPASAAAVSSIFRPSVAVVSVVNIGGSLIAEMTVNTDGTVSFEFRDYTGALLATTAASVGYTMSYGV